MRCCSSPTSGTIFLAASVGVEARRSATRSSSGASGSCPIADTTGVRQAATARTSSSSENGSRSSTLPPPRATTITSTSGCRVQLAHRLDHPRHRVDALHGDVAHLEAHRGPAQPGVLQHVVLGGRRPAAHQPDQLRQERQRLLAVRREQPLRRQRPLQPLQPGQQFADPDRPDLHGAQRQLPARRVPLGLGVHHHPRALADHVGDLARTPARKQVTAIETSCEVSRSVRNTTPAPGRRDSWVICPSTQTAPSRSIQPPISRDTSPTGTALPQTC